MEARLRQFLAWVLSRAIGGIVLGLVGLAFVQVVLRYVFSSAILWVEEVSVMALIWMVWLGIVYLWLTRAHIAVDLIGGALSAPAQRRLAFAIDVLALIGGVTLTWISLETLNIYSGMELGSLEMDASTKYIPVTVGGAGLALAALLDLWKAMTSPEPSK